MDSSSLARLDAAERLLYSRPAAKLLKAPYRMMSARLLSRLAAWRKRPVTVRARTFWGDSMDVLLPDTVSIALYQYRFFESGLTRIVLAQIKPGMTFFDVGAHFGYFTLLGSHLVGPTGHVHSFEPTPNTFQTLKRNTAGRPNVQLNQRAVYAHADTLTFAAYEDHPSFNAVDANAAEAFNPALKHTTYTVQAISLDEYVAATGAKPDVIKLDAEGAEEQILKGMTDTMRRLRPLITLEVGDFVKGRSKLLVQSFLDQGYDAWEYDPTTRDVRPHTLQEDYVFDNLLLKPRA
jgi:FkbM family methyltransferase